MGNYEKIILRDELGEDGKGKSRRAAASVDIIPYGQELLDWKSASQRYGEVLYDAASSVISDRVVNCYIRGKNLSPQKTVRGEVRVYLMPFSIFCNPERWIPLRTATAETRSSMISMEGGELRKEIRPGEVCISQRPFLIDDDYHLKQGEHYCLCAILENDGESYEIPSKFASNVQMDSWVMANCNVALLNVRPLGNEIRQQDFWAEFGNLNEEPANLILILEFYCDFAGGERWSEEIRVRIQNNDSRYPFDEKGRHIPPYQEEGKCQSIAISLYGVPEKYSSKLAVYLEDAKLIPAHGVVKLSSYEILDKLPEGEEKLKERIAEVTLEQGTTGYLLPLGSCYVYNGKMTVGQFNRIREAAEQSREPGWLSLAQPGKE